MAPAPPSTDTDLAAFVQSVERAIAAAYDRLMPLFAEHAQPIVAEFGFHHVAHAESLAHVTGATVPVAPNAALLTALAPRIDAAVDEPSALRLVFALENQLAATHTFSMTMLDDAQIVRAVATILPIESSHAVITGGLLGVGVADLFPNGSFESLLVSDGANPRTGFSPFSYPVS
jgi:hypothetical protein